MNHEAQQNGTLGPGTACFFRTHLVERCGTAPAQEVSLGAASRLGFHEQGWKRYGQFFAPGRVNLIGEHLDYNGGLSLPFAIDLGIEFVLERWEGNTPEASARAGHFLWMGERGSQSLKVVSQEQEPWYPGLDSRASEGMDPYLLGACQIAHDTWCAPERSRPAGFWRILCHSTLPQGAGLSSSAAYSLGLLTCLAMIHGRSFDTITSTAVMAQHIEHRFAGTPCGLMDQLAILGTPHAGYLELDFASPQHRANDAPRTAPLTEVPSVTPRQFPALLQAEYRPLLFYTGRRHQLSDGSYATRRQECHAALEAALGASTLRSQTPRSSVAKPNTLGAWLRDLPGWQTTAPLGLETFVDTTVSRSITDAVLTRRARFVGHEMARVMRTVLALGQLDLRDLDGLLASGHDGLRDNYEVSCAEVEDAVARIRKAKQDLADAQCPVPLIGPRMMGGGWGGSLIMLACIKHMPRIRDTLGRVAESYSSATGCTPSLIETAAHAGLAHMCPDIFKSGHQ